MPPTRLRAASPLLAILLLFAGSRAHGWSNSANLNTPIATGPGYQLAVSMLADGSGGTFVTWCAGTIGTLDIYAQHFDATGAPLWTPAGVLVCNAADNQIGGAMVSDGAGGVLMVWNDFRNGANYDLYARRLNSAGIPQGAANGVPVVVAAGDQIIPRIIPDGSNGMILTWNDGRNPSNDIYAQRITSSGSPVWAINGVPVCAAVGNQNPAGIVPDGAGGAIFAWEDDRGGVEKDVYAQRINPAGASQWTLNGALVSGAVSDQFNASIASDAAGGAYVTWMDIRGPSFDLYAQHLTSGGLPLWTVGGRQITTLSTSELSPIAIADGEGGCIIAWEDYRAGITDADLYAQRLNASGTKLWANDGAPICVMSGGQFHDDLISDGLGGAILVWGDERVDPTTSDLYAQRLSATGSALWTANGAAVSTAASSQSGAASVLDGAHGVIVGFTDTRNGGNDDSFMQRIEQFGYLGGPEPDLVSVRDVANDQGGRVRLSWTRSYLDTGPGSPANEYRVWRQVPFSVAEAGMRSGGTYRVEGFGPEAFYWELAGSQPANGFTNYSLVTNTESDSVAGSNPLTVFMIEARQTSTGYHWDSPPDSGYSVDDLAPPVPAPFTGTYADGTSYMQWGTNPASDLANYRLYRGATSDFVPSPITRIANPTTTSYADALGSPRWYKVSAVDVHGNESGFATLLPGGTVDVASGTVRELRLGPPTPNPARASTAFRLTLPAEAAVRAEFFDQQGRLVRSIPERRLDAGEHEIVWDGRLASGAPASSGLYFYRVSVGERRLEGRIAIIH
ncbi:MAG: FlgD immunoglobulin-like domain containing protein [Candidatus Eisenbacteria bacterium]